MNTIAWIGSILLAFCAVPEAYKSYKTKTSELTWSFLGMWGFGELFIAIPVILEIKVGFLVFNYIINLVFILFIVYHKFRGKRG